MSENIIVGVRCRPFDERELERNEIEAWDINTKDGCLEQIKFPPINENKLKYNRAKRKQHLKYKGYNHVFGPKSTTRDVYDALAKDIVQSSLSGINGTVFAYGQTASGKTYTMKGNVNDLGVMVLAIRDIFVRIRQNNDATQFLLRVAYMEIYNEQTRDLLSEESKTLEIRENGQGFFVKGLTERIVTSLPEVLELMQTGEKRRHYGQTNMNDLSSRSHTIFRLIIESKPKSDDNNDNLSNDQQQYNNKNNKNRSKVKVSCLNFVDLAGSERMNQTGTVGHAAKEARHINLSLFQLGTVINELLKNPNGHIPFRDSALTRILQSSLGGNSRTSIICTISPALSNAHHTTSTLQFAQRAVKVKTHAKVNEVSATLAMIDNHLIESAELSKRTSCIPHVDLSTNSDAIEEEIKRELELKLNHLRILVYKATSALRPSDIHQTNRVSKKFNATNNNNINCQRRHSTTSLYAFNESKLVKFNDDTFPLSLTEEQVVFYSRAVLNSELKRKTYRCNQLEELITDMSKENADLLDQIQGHVIESEALSSRNDQLEKQISELEKFVQVFSGGDGIENLSEKALVQLHDAMSATLPKVLKQIHYCQFVRAGLIKPDIIGNSNVTKQYDQDELVQQVRKNTILQEQLNELEQICVQQQEQEENLRNQLKQQSQEVNVLREEKFEEKNKSEEMSIKVQELEKSMQEMRAQLQTKQMELDKLKAVELEHNLVALNQIEKSIMTPPPPKRHMKTTTRQRSATTTNSKQSRIPRVLPSPMRLDTRNENLNRQNLQIRSKYNNKNMSNDDSDDEIISPSSASSPGFLKNIFSSAKKPVNTRKLIK